MKGSKILIVDDEDNHTRSMMRLLFNRGYVVSAVDNIHSAIKTLGMVDYDVVVVGMKDAQKDGIEALKTIRDNHKKTKAIFLTNDQDKRSAEKAVKLGAFDSLDRSCNVGELEEKILHVKDGKKQAQQEEFGVSFSLE